MAGLPKGPLSDQDYAKINKELAAQERVRQEIEKATEAGFPCAEMDSECKARIAMLTKIKQVYFPDRP